MSPLYAIVDVDVCTRAGRAPDLVTLALLRTGISHLQIRAKHLGARDYLALVERVAPAARSAGVELLVNDRVDVAKSSGVGVHLGQDDLSVRDARRLLGPAAVVGYSTHTLEQLDAALREPCSYVAMGPVYATSTKAAPDPVVGLDGVSRAAAKTRPAGMPLVAIGGITLSMAPAVVAAGADAVAVISDLVGHADEPAVRASRFLSVLGKEPV